MSGDFVRIYLGRWALGRDNAFYANSNINPYYQNIRFLTD